ncbi:hypothetical protein GO495_24805 [Chitinophaga oryziterrae]|uniref:Uncharacterized protein n=1 Tax=Chitinophaga oryziterrae TaxID=1031224 RepID=A0A6N8JHU1_9BACT|nr:hypothetical protein [Chitinophaga oryziterrae]MVT43838.1 hypothetical protein [Chitinophaga oryziterrae]
MNNYLIKTSEGELKIMQVKPADEASFHATYSNQIIASGSSIQEILIKYGELLNGESGQ